VVGGSRHSEKHKKATKLVSPLNEKYYKTVESFCNQRATECISFYNRIHEHICIRISHVRYSYNKSTDGNVELEIKFRFES